MTTSVKAGWARQQYGKDRWDVEIDLTDLPRIMSEHGADPEAAATMPFSVAMDLIGLEAEILGKAVYYKHEQEEARTAGATSATAAMMAIKREVPQLKARRDALLAPYLTEEGKAARAAAKAKTAEPART